MNHQSENKDITKLKIGNKDRKKNYQKKEYWLKENLAFQHPHFRLEKCANIINTRAKGRECDLLDLGCGPGTLGELLNKNIHYYGMDIALHRAGPNFHESDFVQEPITFNGKSFDFIVASGVFEYMGNFQHKKFSEIEQILNEDGEFIVTFSNIHHRKLRSDVSWNNFQAISEFREDLQNFFHIKRFFASSHNRLFYPPENPWMRRIQMKMNVYIPLISPKLAVEYFFICSKRLAV